jgi:hypothetical protein
MLATMFVMAGCASPDISPRPPKRADEIVVPPVEEAKFSNPPNYPEPSNQNNDPSRALAGRNGQPNVGAMTNAATNGMGRSMGPMSGMGGAGMGGPGMGGMGR